MESSLRARFPAGRQNFPGSANIPRWTAGYQQPAANDAGFCRLCAVFSAALPTALFSGAVISSADPDGYQETSIL